MGNVILKKRASERSTYELAVERVAILFDRYDHVAVSFSGGKDSTVCLHLALDEARRRARLPLDVFCWDEEAIHPETVAYLERVQSNPDIALRWLCQPVEHRNACSRRSPYWWPWDPDNRDLWCRPMPAGAIHDPAFERRPIPRCNASLFGPELGSVAVILGLRAEESVRRFMVVSRREHDNWISPDSAAQYITLAKPIYDWSTADVWTAPAKFGWDYNHTYDEFRAAGVPPHLQRVCPPFGEEPLQNLYLYAVCWPELWERMIRRVPGAATAARYSRSPLYGHGARAKLEEGDSYQAAIVRELNKWQPIQRSRIARRIACEIERHYAREGQVPIPERAAEGLSWQFLHMIAVRGDFKGRKKVRYDDEVVRPKNTAA